MSGRSPCPPAETPRHRARQVTTGAFAEEDPVWSADGARILFTSTRVAEPYYEASDEDLFAVAAEEARPRWSRASTGPSARAAPSPDGRRIAFRGTLNGKPLRSYTQPDLFVMDVAGAPPRNLTAALDFDVMSGLAGDQRAPRGGGQRAIAWPKDGRSLLFAAAEKGTRQRAAPRPRRRAAARRHRAATRRSCPSPPAPTASRIVALVSTATEIGDLFVIDANGGRAPAA